MKKHLLRLAGALRRTGLLSVGAAAEREPAFSFDLSVDGKTEKTVATGDIITVTLTLRRRDSGESYPMYAMQDESCYDADFFRLVPGSGLTAANVVTRDVALRDYHRAYYMNYRRQDLGGRNAGGQLSAGGHRHGRRGQNFQQQPAGCPTKRQRELFGLRAECDGPSVGPLHGGL